MWLVGYVRDISWFCVQDGALKASTDNSAASPNDASILPQNNAIGMQQGWERTTGGSLENYNKPLAKNGKLDLVDLVGLVGLLQAPNPGCSALSNGKKWKVVSNCAILLHTSQTWAQELPPHCKCSLWVTCGSGWNNNASPQSSVFVKTRNALYLYKSAFICS